MKDMIEQMLADGIITEETLEELSNGRGEDE